MNKNVNNITIENGKKLHHFRFTCSVCKSTMYLAIDEVELLKSRYTGSNRITDEAKERHWKVMDNGNFVMSFSS